MGEGKAKNNRKFTLYGIAGSVAIVVGGFFLYRFFQQDEDNDSQYIASTIVDTKDITVKRKNPTQTDTIEPDLTSAPVHQNGINGISNVVHHTEQMLKVEQTEPSTLETDEKNIALNAAIVDEPKSTVNVILENALHSQDIEMITEQNIEIPQPKMENESPILVRYEEDLEEEEEEEEEEHALTPNSMEKVESKEQIEKQIENENKWTESIRKYSEIADAATRYKHYQYKNGTLLVKVVKASNIGKSVRSGAPSGAWCDGIVELKLADNKNCSTRVVQNKRNPKWNESFKLTVTDTVRDRLECVLYDNEIKESNRIGQLIINVIDIAGNNGFLFRTFDVMRSKSDATLELELSYFEETSL